MTAGHYVTQHGTTDCPVEGVRAEVEADGQCSACGAQVGQPAPPATADLSPEDRPRSKRRTIGGYSSSDRQVNDLRPPPSGVASDRVSGLSPERREREALVERQEGLGMSELTADEMQALLSVWPWPREAATTREGFAAVTNAVAAIVAKRTSRLAAVREYVDDPGNWSAADRRREVLLALIDGRQA